MAIDIFNAEVRTRDGHAGQVSRIIVNPRNGRVTHLVVQHGVWAESGVLVPLEAIRLASAGTLWLATTQDELRKMAPYRYENFLEPEICAPTPLVLPYGMILWPASRTAHAKASTSADAPKPGTIALGVKSNVYCTDGVCGSLRQLCVDEKTGAVAGFVIHQGGIKSRDIQAPVTWLGQMDSQGVHLTLTQRELEEQAAVRSG
jgi:sporulation protein YlmC with PRC-barrel domain